MLKSIEVRNVIGTLVANLPILVPTPDSPYVITDIDGLGPVKATINTSDYAIQDGGSFQSARTGGRNIVMTLEYNKLRLVTKTVESLRRELYSVFPPESQVTLRFFNTDSQFKTVEIVGRVESVEPDIFSAEPKVQISILCPKPSFYELDEVYRTGSTREPLGQPYHGDAEVGFYIRMFMNGSDFTKVIVTNDQVAEDLVMDFSPALGATGETTLEISTIPGNKFVRSSNGTTVVNRLDNIVSGSLSMTLGPIVQSLIVDVIPVAGQSGLVPVELKYVPAYIGL